MSFFSLTSRAVILFLRSCPCAAGGVLGTSSPASSLPALSLAFSCRKASISFCSFLSLSAALLSMATLPATVCFDGCVGPEGAVGGTPLSFFQLPPLTPFPSPQSLHFVEGLKPQILHSGLVALFQKGRSWIFRVLATVPFAFPTSSANAVRDGAGHTWRGIGHTCMKIQTLWLIAVHCAA